MVNYRRYVDLAAHLHANYAQGDTDAWWYTQRLQATADGRYSYHPTFNAMVDASELVHVRPVGFQLWLASTWAAARGW